MIKKLIIMGILMIPFLLLTRMATALPQEKISAEIGAKLGNQGNQGNPNDSIGFVALLK